MSRRAARDFWCAVVSESVQIRLRRADGFEPQRGHVVQCNQAECQHVDQNAPPCPLHIGLFADEIKAIEAARSSCDEYGMR